MFDIGMQELIVIFIVALLVFGPKRLPELGKTLGKGIAELKKAMYNVKEQMNTELGDVKKPTEKESSESLVIDERIRKIKELEDQDSKSGTEG